MENGENDGKNPFLTPISCGTSFVSGSSISHSSDTQVPYHLGHAYFGTSFPTTPSSLPACPLCSALTTFPLCSKKPLYRPFCLPGVPYFISFLWGIPSYPSEPTQMSAPQRLSLTDLGRECSFLCSDAAQNVAQEHELCSHTIWAQVQALLFTCFVSLHKLLTLFVSRFP